MTRQKWTYSEKSSAIGDTGDYVGFIQFTNGIDILQTSNDEIDEIQMQQFCDLLDAMPDLWSHKLDAAEFEISQLQKKLIWYEKIIGEIK